MSFSDDYLTVIWVDFGVARMLALKVQPDCILHAALHRGILHAQCTEMWHAVYTVHAGLHIQQTVLRAADVQSMALLTCCLWLCSCHCQYWSRL